MLCHQKSFDLEMQPVKASQAVTEPNHDSLTQSSSDSSTDADGVTLVDTAPKSAPSPGLPDVGKGQPRISAREQSLKPKKSYRGIVAFILVICWWFLFGLANILMYVLISHVPEAGQSSMKRKGWTDFKVGVVFCGIATFIIFTHMAVIAAERAVGEDVCRDRSWAWLGAELFMFIFVFLLEVVVQAIVLSEQRRARPRFSFSSDEY